MSEPLITTVIPAYRRPAMLRRAICSVLTQSFPHFRICVYDDASGDETASVVRELQKTDSRLEYVCRPRNVGYLVNFVDASSRITTPFFSFLSDDDVMLPGFFKVAIEGFNRYPEAALSILTSIRMSATGLTFDAPLLHWPEGLLPAPDGMLSILRHGNPDLASLLIRRDVWEQLGGWDPEIGPCFDVDFELRASSRFPVVVSKQPGGVLLVHRGSNEAKSCLEWVWPALPRMASKLVQDESIPAEARQEGAAILTGMLKKGLITRGVMRSIAAGRWDDAEKASRLFLDECNWSSASNLICPARRIGQKLPGIGILLRTLFATRAYLRAVGNLDLQWRFRAYAKLLRTSCLEDLQPEA
jgi:hypothetical protein